jgi:UPF0755 protein
MNTTKNYMFAGVWLIALIGVLIYGYNQIFLTPSNFPTGKSFIINENESLASVSKRLEEGGFITSPLLFRMSISFLGQDRNIKLGGYSFDAPMSLLGVVDAFVRNGPNAPLLSVTIPEGSTLTEVTSLITKTLPSLSQELFMNLVKSNNLDGKLFPSTYFLLPSSTEESIIKMMFTTFTKKVEPIINSSSIPSPLKDANEVIVLASILEGEAKTETDMKIIAGILLQRLTIGMPLQVDVSFETYKTKGLPKEPINNPGIVAITSVLNPTPSQHLYYITGNDGNMYYAKTFDEHKRNIKRYLK